MSNRAPFATHKPHPFCFVDGEAGLVLAPSWKLGTEKEAPSVAGEVSDADRAASKPGLVSN